MNSQTRSADAAPQGSPWLKTYYFLRAAFSIAWVLAAFTVGKQMPAVGTVLLVVYPAWDALANWLDARQSGGLARNPTQKLNLLASGVVALAIAVASAFGMHAVLDVFGLWAGVAGILQLATGLRRWKTAGAQWPMILSGAQSTLAGGLFIHQATGQNMPAITDIAPYAAVGAFYFLVSGISIVVGELRGRRKPAA
ncbi:DUF308 domain-containing protein [Xylophilus rhododendri]|uniref:DUF308 domain-containing protein n=1 Tax=Xylophilus rhododendri TaxID=2697032 RepID=A0A857J0P0_9BURK|nr:DUF308 domain-containing protein [Xylophilus rhododendri]QHI97430.1 DUF308 domain-containing protein [Xylophilus rhododendri]